MAILSVSQSRRPPGISFLEHQRIHLTSEQFKTIVFVLTFLAYFSYHAARKTTSIVKSDLNPRSSELGFSTWGRSHFLKKYDAGIANPTQEDGWDPFNGPNGNELLGVIDVTFLFTYACGMYLAGHLGDRWDLRIFLTIGMIGTASFTALFGAGWPSVMAIMGNWYGRTRKGLIMGIWNAHTSIGNITGSLVAAALLEFGWGWSFAALGLLMFIVGLIVYFFLPTTPEAVGAEIQNEDVTSDNTDPLLSTMSEGEAAAVGFLQAWRIPDVVQYAICLFFAKLVAYTFLYWLPFYISHTAIGGRFLSDSESGFLSTFFDIGGIAGGILAGYIYDYRGAGAITSCAFLICSVPAILFYRIYGTISLFWNIILMCIAGLCVNAPYALVTTAVSAQLGTHGSRRENSRARATVAAIVDGTGSLGSAIGPLLTGYLSTKSWSAVFYMLMVSALLGALVLVQPIIKELTPMSSSDRSQGADVPSSSMDITSTV